MNITNITHSIMLINKTLIEYTNDNSKESIKKFRELQEILKEEQRKSDNATK